MTFCCSSCLHTIVLLQDVSTHHRPCVLNIHTKQPCRSSPLRKSVQEVEAGCDLRGNASGFELVFVVQQVLCRAELHQIMCLVCECNETVFSDISGACCLQGRLLKLERLYESLKSPLKSKALD